MAAKGKGKGKSAAKDKADTKGKGKGAEKPKKDPKKKRGATGTTWGLNVVQTWYKLMKRNYREKLTDEQMAEFMRDEFPSKKKYTIADIKMVRGLFNRGRFNEQDSTAPTKPLPEYDDEGKAIPPRKKGGGKKKKDKKEDVSEEADVEEGEEDDEDDEDDEEEEDDEDDDED